MQHDKLGFYLNTWQTIQRLKGLGRSSPLFSEVREDSLLDLLWKLETQLREQTDHLQRARFQPFPRLRSFYGDLLAFCLELDNVANQDIPARRPMTLGNARYRQLQELLARLEQLFREEVEDRVIFIAPERRGLLEYLSPTDFLYSKFDRQYFRLLPRLSQTKLKDAGKCLVYDLPGAAISMALQAVETTIRFYFVRHGGPRDISDWGPMLDWLNGKQRKLLPGANDAGQLDCYARLQKLRDGYRNAVAHGRAFSADGLSDANLSEAIDVFEECLRGVRIFAAEAARRSSLIPRIAVGRFDFDTVVATFLYNWNPELPPFKTEAVELDTTLNTGTLKDVTIIDSPHWPRLIQATPQMSLSQTVLNCFRVQPNYASTLDSLLQFIDEWRRSSELSDEVIGEKDKDELHIADLFRLLQKLLGDDQQQFLSETWRLLDKLLERSLNPRGPRLYTELEMKSIFDNLRRNDG